MVIWMTLVLLGAQLIEQPPTQTERVADAIAAGAAAEARGDVPALAAAARMLELLGAQPAEGMESVADNWRDAALAQGAPPAQPFRGRALGPAYRSGLLAAGGSLATSQVYLAGQRAVVAVVPEPGRALSVRVGEAGRPSICERAVTAPKGACSWMPTFTRRIEITVSNPATTPVRYWLVSN